MSLVFPEHKEETSQSRPVLWQHLCRGQFQLHQLTLTRCPLGGELGIAVEQHLFAFLPPFAEKEGEKQLDRGTGWLVTPDRVHKGHAEPEESCAPA